MSDETRSLRASRLPLALRSIPDPPKTLRARGSVAAFEAPMIAIVGARRCSDYARDFAFELARQLAIVGVVTVSGLAYGIDAAAHRGALAGGGRTIAVLGGGLRRIYPAAHRGLADTIVSSGGLLLSEYPDDAPSRKHQFPERNRLISGLSLGVVIVEAAASSGSLITARMALEQGREVMAVPGRANDPRQAGSHRLLREGAALIECLEDIEAALELEFVIEHESLVPVGEPATLDSAALDDVSRRVLGEISTSETSVDSIARATSLDTEQVLVAVTLLELDGFVAPSGAGYIRRPFRGP